MGTFTDLGNTVARIVSSQAGCVYSVATNGGVDFFSEFLPVVIGFDGWVFLVRDYVPCCLGLS